MCMANDSVWRLRRGDELVAELVVTGGDFPWLNATVRATPAFDELRPLFAEELRLLDRLDQDVEAWEAAYDRIRREVILERPDAFAVPEQRRPRVAARMRTPDSAADGRYTYGGQAIVPNSECWEAHGHAVARMATRTLSLGRRVRLDRTDRR